MHNRLGLCNMSPDHLSSIRKVTIIAEEYACADSTNISPESVFRLKTSPLGTQI